MRGRVSYTAAPRHKTNHGHFLLPILFKVIHTWKNTRHNLTRLCVESKLHKKDFLDHFVFQVVIPFLKCRTYSASAPTLQRYNSNNLTHNKVIFHYWSAGSIVLLTALPVCLKVILQHFPDHKNLIWNIQVFGRHFAANNFLHISRCSAMRKQIVSGAGGM